MNKARGKKSVNSKQNTKQAAVYIFLCTMNSSSNETTTKLNDINCDFEQFISQTSSVRNVSRINE